MKKKVYLISFILLVIDFFSKLIIKTNNINTTIIPDFFSISYVKNTGAAFSIFEGYSIIFIIIAILAIIYIDKKFIKERLNKLQMILFALLVGGILGNLLDRIIYGYVIDFLSFKIGNYYFPIFNIADICIILGVCLLIIDIVRGEKNDNKSRWRRN